jgi:hypothetical protein
MLLRKQPSAQAYAASRPERLDQHCEMCRAAGASNGTVSIKLSMESSRAPYRRSVEMGKTFNEKQKYQPLEGRLLARLYPGTGMNLVSNPARPGRRLSIFGERVSRATGERQSESVLPYYLACNDRASTKLVVEWNPSL